MVYLSVVMPVHNGEKHLVEAIESILTQSFEDFHLLIGDDGSADSSLAIARRYEKLDSRVQVFSSRDRLGPVGSSNWTAQLANTDLIARMDADDVAECDRLQVQVDLMNRFPLAVAIGSLWTTINADGSVVREPAYFRMIGAPRPPVAHTSLMYRRASFEKVGGYRASTEYWEDSDLIVRLANSGPVIVACAPLVRYRISRSSSRLADPPETVENAIHAFSGVEKRRGRMSPLVYRGLLGLEIMAGGRPRFVVRVLRRMHLGSIAGVVTLLLAGAAHVAPDLLRTAIRLRDRKRNRNAREKVAVGTSTNGRRIRQSSTSDLFPNCLQASEASVSNSDREAG